MSVASIAGVFSPIVFGTVYSISVGDAALLPHPGSAFLLGALVLSAAAITGWKVSRRAEREAAAHAAG